VSSAFLTPASSTCVVHQTLNGGADWEPVTSPHSYESCEAVSLLKYGDSYTGLLRKSTSEWLWSRGDEAGWSRIELTAAPALTVRTASPSPAFGDDGALFVGGEIGGVWSIGPNQMSTNGTLPCSASAVAGFARVLSADVTTRAWLGCPLEPEHPVEILERPMGDHRAIRVGSDALSWFELFPGPAGAWNGWYEHETARDPFPAGADAPVTGAMQRFDGGVMVFLPREGGPRTIITIAESNQQRLWRETLD
jgi:hypothetical protein